MPTLGPDEFPAATKRPWLRQIIGLAMGLSIAGGLLAYLGIPHRAELARDLRAFDIRPLLAAAAGALGLIAIQSVRWWLLMRRVVNLTYGQAYRSLAVGFFFNVLLPARGGDFIRAQYLGKRAGVPRARVLGTEVLDFWCDKLGWLIAFPCVCLLGKPPAWLYHVMTIVGAVLVGVGIAMVFFAVRVARTHRERLPRFLRWLADVGDGLSVTNVRRLAVIVLFVAPLPWLWETLLIMLAGRGLGLHLGFVEAFAVLSAFNAATAVPTPANAGPFEAGGTLALIGFGVPQGQALAFMFMYHLTQVVPTFALGALVLLGEAETILRRRRGDRGGVLLGEAVPPTSDIEVG